MNADDATLCCNQVAHDMGLIFAARSTAGLHGDPAALAKQLFDIGKILWPKEVDRHERPKIAFNSWWRCVEPTTNTGWAHDRAITEFLGTYINLTKEAN